MKKYIRNLIVISLMIFFNLNIIFGVSPSIINISDNKSDYQNGQIPKYEKFEVTFTLDTTYSNPYNPDPTTGGVKIDAYFTPQGGDDIIVPAFWFQDYTRSKDNNGNEVLTIKGSPCWKLRFTPAQTVTYTYTIKLTDQTDIYTLVSGSCEVVDSNNKGFIRINPKNSRYFAFDDGSDFFGIGLDIGWANTYEFDQYYTILAQNGGNFARTWILNARMSNWAISIQDFSLGKNYDLQDAWKLDSVFESAKKNGIYIQLCLEDVNSFTYNWNDQDQWNKGNVYNKTSNPDNGICTDRWDFITMPEARVYHKRVLRYLVARYGYNTNLAAWEQWNEIDEIRWTEPKFNWDELGDWHTDMGQYIKSIDVNKHLITTSGGSFNTVVMSETDYSQMHAYYIPGRSSPDMFNIIADYSEILRKTDTNKPNIFGEFGGAETWFDGNYPDDTTGIHIHNALWTGIMYDLAATPLYWYWYKFFNYPAWWQNYKSVANYLKNENLTDSTLLIVNSDKNNIVTNSGFEDDLTKWIKNPGNSTRFTIDSTNYHEGSKSLKWESNASEALEILHSVTLIPDMEYILTAWIKMDNVTSSWAGIKFAAYLFDGINGGGAQTDFFKGTTDGWTQISLKFTSLSYLGPGYQSNIAINFSSSTGTAWIDDIKISPFGKYKPPFSNNNNLRILAKKNNTAALVWIQNKNHTWYNIGELGNNVNYESASITIPYINNSKYYIEWWDTYNGTIYKKQKAQVSDSTLNLPLPYAINSDIAVKVKPLMDTTAPILDWTGEQGYKDGGVYPKMGFFDDNFTFQVKYTDFANVPPAYIKLFLDKNGNGDYKDTTEIVYMDEVDLEDTDLTNGKNYTKSISIPYTPRGTNISYKFEAYDGISLATGTPTNANNYPDVFIDLSLSTDSTEINYDEISIPFLSVPKKIIVTNNSKYGTATFNINVSKSSSKGSGWMPDIAPVEKKYVLKALFTGIEDISYIKNFKDDDIITTLSKSASSTDFGDNTFLENGTGVPAGESRKLWILFQGPQGGNFEKEENIDLTIGIQAP